jgi:hypothetical protein
LGQSDGWRKRKNVIIVLIVGLSYSGERKDAGIVNNPWMWIDSTKELGSYFSLIGLYSSLPLPKSYD